MKTNTINILAKSSPLLVKNVQSDWFKQAQILPAGMPSSQLGIVNTSKGTKYPEWFKNIITNGTEAIIIDGIDTIDFENQEKFYELLKYQTISSVGFPKRQKIFVTYSNIADVSKTIISLCQILR